MKELRIFTSVILLSVILSSCREVYYPDDIEPKKNIPVIQGKITEGGRPEVQLYWALGYGNSSISYISGADIYLKDDKGNYSDLYEAKPGTYYGDITGTAGDSYILHITLPDGREYESTPQFLQMAPSVDSLYALAGLHTSYVYGNSGAPVYTEEKGLYIKSDLSSEYDNTLHYRFNTIVVKESVYTDSMGLPSEHPVYIWETTRLDNAYSVNYSVSKDLLEVLYGHPAGFLKYYSDVTKQTRRRSATFIIAWIITQNIYSISADVYQYYNSIERNLQGNDRIFSPVASQVKSNIHCLTDPDEKVIGVFEASSVTTLYRAFAWKDLAGCKSLGLSFFPEVGNGISRGIKPDFWIQF